MKEHAWTDINKTIGLLIVIAIAVVVCVHLLWSYNYSNNGIQKVPSQTAYIFVDCPNDGFLGIWVKDGNLSVTVEAVEINGQNYTGMWQFSQTDDYRIHGTPYSMAGEGYAVKLPITLNATYCTVTDEQLLNRTIPYLSIDEYTQIYVENIGMTITSSVKVYNSLNLTTEIGVYWASGFAFFLAFLFFDHLG